MGWKKIKKLQAQNHNDPQTSTNFCKDPQTSAKIHKAPMFMKTYEKCLAMSCSNLFAGMPTNSVPTHVVLPRAPRALHQSLEHRAGEHATTSRYNRKARHNDAKQMQHGCKTDATWMQMNNLGTMYQNSVTLISFAATGYQKPRGDFQNMKCGDVCFYIKGTLVAECAQPRNLHSKDRKVGF